MSVSVVHLQPCMLAENIGKRRTKRRRADADDDKWFLFLVDGSWDEMVMIMMI